MYQLKTQHESSLYANSKSFEGGVKQNVDIAGREPNGHKRQFNYLEKTQKTV